VFCPRLSTLKTMRIEKLIASFTDASFVAFTGDDEASLKMISFSPFFWLRRILIHNRFTKHVKTFSYYFMHSAVQAELYHNQYHIKTGTLLKSGNFCNCYKPKKNNMPIKIVYAGRLYCNRWKILREIGWALERLNSDGIQMILSIYTQDQISKIQKAALNDNKSIFLKGSVTPESLKNIYLESDIALHVESFDKVNRLLTKYSFSTKIIDCLGSSCAVMAIAWEKQAGFTYLKDHDAAICISDCGEIYETLKKIVKNPILINEYSRKAYDCGLKYHNRVKIQNQIRTAFNDAIKINKLSKKNI
jgi:hypothetical protein